MAKGKKSSGTHYVSKGERRSVYGGVSSVRKSKTTLERTLNKVNAWLAGKNPWITYENPNKLETNKRFIKVKSNNHWGNPKKPREAPNQVQQS